jgi:hypothetical protein
MPPDTLLMLDTGSVVLVCGKGETFHNGAKLKQGQSIALAPYDRLVIGGEILLFRHPIDARDTAAAADAPAYSAEAAVAEYQRALTKGAAGRRKSTDASALETQLMQMQMQVSFSGTVA